METYFQSESLSDWAPAFLKAQKAMGGATKDSKNPFFHSDYADLRSVINACREALNNNGICILQPVSNCEMGVTVTTILLHESEQYMGSTIDFPADKSDPQEYGKLITYAKRYSLQAFTALPSEDSDAEPQRQPGKPGKATARQEAPARKISGRAMNFGRDAGQPLMALSVESLEWYAKVLMENIDDPNKANFKAKNETALLWIEEELNGRTLENLQGGEPPLPMNADEAPPLNKGPKKIKAKTKGGAAVEYRQEQPEDEGGFSLMGAD